jgi:hypothetical protein
MCVCGSVTSLAPTWLVVKHGAALTYGVHRGDLKKYQGCGSVRTSQTAASQTTTSKTITAPMMTLPHMGATIT